MSIDSSKFLSDPKYFNVSPASSKSPFIIGVAGGPASGKKDVCAKIMEQLSKNHATKVALLSLNDFYRELSDRERELAEKGEFNFDNPNAFDQDLLTMVLADILDAKTVEVPIYNHATRKREGTRVIDTPDVVLFEGILILYWKNIRDVLAMKIFVDVDSDTRLARRVLQDIQSRQHSIDYILEQWVNFVKPSFEDFILQTKNFADIVVPRGVENLTAIKLIASHISDLLKARSSTTYVSSPVSSPRHSLMGSRESMEEERVASPLERIRGDSIRRKNSGEILETKINLYTPVPQ